jgi:hypothetical protein
VGAASEDVLFRPYAFRDLVHRARMVYRLWGCEENIDLVEDVAPHGYTPKIRRAIFSAFARHLQGARQPVVDDLRPEEESDDDLAVYPTKRPPPDDRLGEIDKFFVPLPGPPEVKDRRTWEAHQRSALDRLRATTFRWMPAGFPAVEHQLRRQGQSEALRFRTFEFESEPGLPIQAELGIPIAGPRPYPLLVAPLAAEAESTFCLAGSGLGSLPAGRAGGASVSVRGTGASALGPGLEWTVRRAYPILGQSLPERQTLDLLQGIAVLRAQPNVGRIAVFGHRRGAALAVYAALLDPRISEIVLDDPVTTHWKSGPEFLCVLKVGDLPHNLALAFPRPITFVGRIPPAYEWTRRCYQTCGAGDKIRVVANLAEWQ